MNVICNQYHENRYHSICEKTLINYSKNYLQTTRFVT